ncbi:MAG: molybdate ABC transporter substrate-binding protein [Caulobacteraceae bacterium]|nr:molybdate ABC transporter substrate-binding protein [Caulobacter sp.]
MIRRRFGLALAALLALGAAPVRAAAPVPVAVAANFTEPAKEIAAAFHAATGETAVLSFGASGGFYTQISHGAPYEVFLSADVERAAKAEQDGFAAPGSRFTYATGTLVLYSRTPGLVDGRGEVLRQPGRFAKLAIADPATAPYGEAAVETMRKLGVADALKPKLVQGASITQAYQFTATGAAELGFVALSQVIAVPGGSRWVVPESLHAPIDQAAVLLKTGANDAAARKFMTFLKGPQARAIIRRYGYSVR